ncbi:MAG: hypothetical protein IJC83_02740, partial [Oscillospiraceae bacterium]|nr:hypothetical protein [Oscillospiraceae bacterium]
MSRGGRYRDEYFRKDGRQSDEFLRSDTRYSDEFVRTDEFSFLNETEMASESFIHSDEFNMDSEVSLKEKSAIEDFELGGEQEAASQTTMVMGAGTIKVGAITAAAVMSVSTVAINHEHTFAQGWTTTVEATCLHNGTEELI